MLLIKDFVKDLDSILSAADRRDHFAFSRFADGEHAVLTKTPLTGYDWRMAPEFEVVSRELEAALGYRASNYYFGVSCPCCDKEKSEYYRKELGTIWNDRVTYSNIFVNGNYSKVISWLKDKEVIIFGNDKLRGATNLPFKVIDAAYFPANSVELFNDENRMQGLKRICEHIASKYSDKIFLISVGPISKIVIKSMFQRNPRNSYIDIGSVVDPYIHGSTRIYHHHPTWQNMICHGLK